MCVVNDVIMCLEDKCDQNYPVPLSTSTKLKCILVKIICEVTSPHGGGTSSSMCSVLTCFTYMELTNRTSP